MSADMRCVRCARCDATPGRVKQPDGYSAGTDWQEWLVVIDCYQYYVDPARDTRRRRCYCPNCWTKVRATIVHQGSKRKP